MGNDVFANGREISCKAADGKSVCAFPDVCFTPPQTPATPPGVPLPYPNTGFAKDTTKGSKSVKITDKEVMLKNKSHFKTSTGDEAGCAPKKGFVTSKIKGKIYFTAWSMDVKFEGKNVVRHLDLTTHNHSSQIGNESIPWLHVDTMAFDLSDDCKEEQKKFQKACGDCIKRHPDNSINSAGTSEAMCSKPACKEARQCTLLPYSIKCCKDKNGKKQTPHHLIPNSLLQGRRNNNKTNVKGLKSYTMKSAPCCCVSGRTQTQLDHGKIHDGTKDALRGILEAGKEVTYESAKKSAVKAHTDAIKGENGKPACKAKCLEAQLDVHFTSRSQNGNPNDIKLRQQDGATSKKFGKAGKKK